MATEVRNGGFHAYETRMKGFILELHPGTS